MKDLRRTLYWVVCQPGRGTTRSVMGVSDSVTTSFPPPVIHDSRAFLSAPFLCSNSSCAFFSSLFFFLFFYAINLHPTSLLPAPSVRLIHRAARRAVITPWQPFPRKPPFSGAKPARRAEKTLTRWGVRGRLPGFWGEDGDVFLDLGYDLRDWP